MKRINIIPISALILFFLLITLSDADTIYLKNGDKIETKRAWEEKGWVNFLKPGSSLEIVLSIKGEDVERIETETEPDKPIKQSKNIRSIKVRGRTISIGDTQDEIITIVGTGKAAVVNEDISGDPNCDSGLYIIRTFNIGYKFTLHVARPQCSGPYRVVRIILPK